MSANKSLFHSLSIPQNTKVPKCRPKHSPIHLLVVLGSGGHTAEMFSMLRRMQLNTSRYSYRTYVVSSGDEFSAAKAIEFEKSLQGEEDVPFPQGVSLPGAPPPLLGGPSPLMDGPPPLMNGPPPVMGALPPLQAATPQGVPSQDSPYTIVTIPRARRVHQSFFTAPHSTLQCFWACIRVLCGRYPDQKPVPLSYSPYPDLILTNGPATAVCVIMAAKFLRLFRRYAMKEKKQGNMPTVQDIRLRTIFVESWARVTTLSLSGKLLLPFVDRFLVQWPALEGKAAWWSMRKTEYAGALVD